MLPCSPKRRPKQDMADKTYLALERAYWDVEFLLCLLPAEFQKDARLVGDIEERQRKLDKFLDKMEGSWGRFGSHNEGWRFTCFRGL